MDGLVLALSIFVFKNEESGLLGLISLYACTRVIEDMGRSATLMNGKGAYSGQDAGVLLCTVRRSQFGRLKQIID